MLPEHLPAIAVQDEKPPIHTSARPARAPTRIGLPTVTPYRTWGWVCCEIRATLRAALANAISSALGTPLDWPEAKKVAGQVRSWGIEVRSVTTPGGLRTDVIDSNYSLSGAMLKARRGMPFFGEIR